MILMWGEGVFKEELDFWVEVLTFGLLNELAVAHDIGKEDVKEWVAAFGTTEDVYVLIEECAVSDGRYLHIGDCGVHRSADSECRKTIIEHHVGIVVGHFLRACVEHMGAIRAKNTKDGIALIDMGREDKVGDPATVEAVQEIMEQLLIDDAGIEDEDGCAIEERCCCLEELFYDNIAVGIEEEAVVYGLPEGNRELVLDTAGGEKMEVGRHLGDLMI